MCVYCNCATVYCNCATVYCNCDVVNTGKKIKLLVLHVKENRWLNKS